MTTFHCNACQKPFEVNSEHAKYIFENQKDPDTCHEPILCAECTLDAIRKEDQIINEELEQEEQHLTYEEMMICYNCGNNLEVGIDSPGKLCYTCVTKPLFNIEKKPEENTGTEQLGTYAQKRELHVLKTIKKEQQIKSVFSDVILGTTKMNKLSHGEKSFDYVRVALLDLQAKGLIKIEFNGWELTEEGNTLLNQIEGVDDDIPF